MGEQGLKTKRERRLEMHETSFARVFFALIKDVVTHRPSTYVPCRAVT